ncbi:MAG: hypothetical protein NEHIOOID_00031 [Holosporales bacterium]
MRAARKSIFGVFIAAFLMWVLLHTAVIQHILIDLGCRYVKENYKIEISVEGFEHRTWTRFQISSLTIALPAGDSVQLKNLNIDLFDHFLGVKDGSIEKVILKTDKTSAFEFYPFYQKLKPNVQKIYGFSSFIHQVRIGEIVIDEMKPFFVEYKKEDNARAIALKQEDTALHFHVHPNGDTFALSFDANKKTPYALWKDRFYLNHVMGDISLNPKSDQIQFDLKAQMNEEDIRMVGSCFMQENGFLIDDSWVETNARKLTLKGCIDHKKMSGDLFLSLFLNKTMPQKIDATAHMHFKDDQLLAHVDLDRSDFKDTIWDIITPDHSTVDVAYKNNEWKLDVALLRDNPLRVQMKDDVCLIKMQKKGSHAFFDKIDVTYHVMQQKLKGVIDLIGENMIQIDQTFKNDKINGKIFVNLKDFAPLSTPFDLASVGRIKGNLVFDNFSIDQRTGKLLIDLHSKFFRTGYVKVDMTTLKGTVWGNGDADVLFASKDFTLGKYLFFLGKGFMAEHLETRLVGKDGIYKFNTKAHAHKIGYLSSDVRVVIDGEFNKNTQCLTVHDLDFLHLKQHLKLHGTMMLHLSPLKLDDLHLTINDKDLHIKNFAYGHSWTGSLTFTDIDLSILSWFLYKTMVTGTATGNLHLSGNGSVPDFKGSFVGLGVQWGQFKESVQSIHDKINLSLSGEKEGDIFTYDAKIKSEKRVDLILSGSFDWQKKYCDRSILKGHIDMSLISSLFATGDRLCGDIELDLGLKGNFDAPIWQGYIQANDLYVELSEFGTVISYINGKILTHGNKWTVQSLHATDKPLTAVQVKNPGTVNITGNIIFENLLQPKVDLKARVEHYLIVDMDAIVSKASGDLTIKGEGIYSTIKGLVDVEKLMVDIDQLHTEDGIPEIKLKDPKKRSYAKDYQAERAHLKEKILFPLDLTLKMNNNFFMSGSILSESLWGGDIKVLGPINKASLDGVVHAQKGQIDFFGKVLKVDYGKLIFNRFERNEPQLYLQASRKVGDISILLKIHTDQNPIIQFDSSPSMPTDEILAWLLFGKSAGSVSAGQSIQLATALAKLQGQKAFNVMDDLRKGIGLDTFEFREQSTRSTSNFDTTSNQVLHVGKKITDALEVTVEQGATQGTSKVALEMDVGNNISLNTGVSRESDPSKPDDTKNNMSLGVSWNNRY